MKQWESESEIKAQLRELTEEVRRLRKELLAMTSRGRRVDLTDPDYLLRVRTKPERPS